MRASADPRSTDAVRRDVAVGPERVTGAQSIVRSLEEAGVEVVFGIPGGAILPAYDPLFDSTKLRHVLVRHEQGGGHAATGYAQATGKVGVCMATSGPGATNLVTGYVPPVTSPPAEIYARAIVQAGPLHFGLKVEVEAIVYGAVLGLRILAIFGTAVFLTAAVDADELLTESGGA
mgnify:CR=1 FL=1